MTLVCIGQSHLGAVSRGAQELGLDLVAVRMVDLNRGRHKDDPGGLKWQELASAIETHKPERILCFVGGGTPGVLGIAQHDIRFDFALPWRPDLPPAVGAEVIPYDAMRALMEQKVKRHLHTLARVRRYKLPVFQFETPPPIPDNETLARMAARFVDRVGNHRSNAARFGISEPYLRYKIWALHSRVFKDFCAESGIAYIDNPPAAFDEHGFLARDCWNDFVHGNTHYGTLVLRNLENL